MNSLSLLTFCGIAVSAMLHIVISFPWAQAAATKATPLIVGTWKLNPEKSGIRLPPNSTEIRQYRLRPDGFLVGLLITANAQQGYHYLQFTAKSDGKDYPEYTDNLLADLMATGKETTRTYSEKNALAQNTRSRSATTRKEDYLEGWEHLDGYRRQRHVAGTGL